MCWTYFHRDWPAIHLLLGRTRLAYTVGDLSQWRRKGWRFIQKEKKKTWNLIALKCRWWCGENHFLSFFLSFIPEGRRWQQQEEVEVPRFSGGGERACTSKTLGWNVSTPFFLSLSLIYSHADVHTPLTDSYPPDKRPFLICVTIHADGPLFARGSLELLPFE